MQVSSILNSPPIVHSVDFNKQALFNHIITPIEKIHRTFSLGTNQNVVNGDVNQLDEIADESHNDEANSSGSSSLSELYSVK